MRMQYKGKPAEVWQISPSAPCPTWVRDAFKKGYLKWQGKELQILLWALENKKHPKRWFNGLGSLGKRDASLCGNGLYALGVMGDVIDKTNYRVISPKQFEKEYRPIKD